MQDQEHVRKLSKFIVCGGVRVVKTEAVCLFSRREKELCGT